MDEEHAPQGFGMTFTSVSIIILSIFVYLNSIATFEPGKRRKAIASIDANFPKVGETRPVALAGHFPIPQAISELQQPNRSDRFGGVSKRDKGGSIEIVRAEDGFSAIIDADQLFKDTEINPKWTAFLRSLSDEVRNQDWQVEVGIHESGDTAVDGWTRTLQRAQQATVALLQAGIPIERLSVAAFGASRPIASNETPDGQRLNRRVEIRLSDFMAGEELR